MKKVIVHKKQRVFDGFFKIDEAEVSYERFDGQLTGRQIRECSVGRVKNLVWLI